MAYICARQCIAATTCNVSCYTVLFTVYRSYIQFPEQGTHPLAVKVTNEDAQTTQVVAQMANKWYLLLVWGRREECRTDLYTC